MSAKLPGASSPLPRISAVAAGNEVDLRIASARVSVPVEFKVHDWKVPEVKDYGQRYNLYQSPDTVAQYYKVPLWSDRHWELMGKVMEEQSRLRDLYDAPKRDADAITDSHKKISELQRKMYEDSADAHKRMEAVLTKEQKEKSWRFWRKDEE